MSYADLAARAVFAQISGKQEIVLDEIDATELRWALVALASGASLANLRGNISNVLFVWLEKLNAESPENLSVENILAALQENFGASFVQFANETDEAMQTRFSKVFGASLINFPNQSLPKGIVGFPVMPTSGGKLETN